MIFEGVVIRLILGWVGWELEFLAHDLLNSLWVGSYDHGGNWYAGNLVIDLCGHGVLFGVLHHLK